MIGREPPPSIYIIHGARTKTFPYPSTHLCMYLFDRAFFYFHNKSISFFLFTGDTSYHQSTSTRRGRTLHVKKSSNNNKERQNFTHTYIYKHTQIHVVKGLDLKESYVWCIKRRNGMERQIDRYRILVCQSGQCSKSMIPNKKKGKQNQQIDIQALRVHTCSSFLSSDLIFLCFSLSFLFAFVWVCGAFLFLAFFVWYYDLSLSLSKTLHLFFFFSLSLFYLYFPFLPFSTVSIYI